MTLHSSSLFRCYCRDCTVFCHWAGCIGGSPGEAMHETAGVVLHDKCKSFIEREELYRLASQETERR